MAQIKSKSEQFNRDLLDDGVLGHADAAPTDVFHTDEFETDSHETRLARLRAEIQLGIDDEEAGRGTVYATAEDLFNAIIARGFEEDDEPTETAGDHAKR